MLFFSPLEQFELSIIFPLGYLNFDFSVTTVSIYFLFVVLFICSCLFFWCENPRLVPLFGQYLIERVYFFIFSLVKEQVGKVGYRYFPVHFCVFVFILFSNLFGLVPFSFTTTAHVAVTVALALSFNAAFIVLGFYEHGVRFLNLFVPSGAPAFLLPLIVVIEVVSYLIRTLSLSVRLFANMMAGHTLLHILASFSVGFLNLDAFFLSHFAVFLPLLVTFLVFFLELGIAFIQAYVFTILLCIYLNDSYSPGH